MKPPARPAVGRPALYCQEVHDKLVEMAREGGFRKLQAMHAGIALSTLETWLQDAAKNPETSPYGQLMYDLERAEAERALEALRVARRGDTGPGSVTWTSAMTYLERKYPSQYGRRVHEVTGEGGGPMRFVVNWPGKAAEEPEAEPES